MKTLKYICFAGLGLLSLTTVSCSDFLEETPKGQITQSNVDIENLVYKCYSSLNWRFYRIGQMWFPTHEICGDDYEPINTTLKEFQTFSYNADNSWLERYWDQYYMYLNDCNQVLAAAKQTDEIPMAEARFFRAFYHFDLMNVFGDIVIRDHVPTDSKDINIPKSSEEDVYKFIIKDLEYSIEHLPTLEEWGEAERGRVTKGTAQGLLAKVYLYKGDYPNALKYAKEVIQGGEYSLDPNYRQIYRPITVSYSVENMMPGHYVYKNITGRLRNPMVEWQGIPIEGGGDFGSAMLVPSQSIVDAYENGDSRKEASIFQQGEGLKVALGGVKANGYKLNYTSLTGEAKTAEWKIKTQEAGKEPVRYKYANKKVIWDSQWPMGEGFMSQELNMQFMRYADILLIAAEAANETGNTSEALGYLNQVRSRARRSGNGQIPEDVTSGNKEQLRHLIWNERRVELAFEGQRWFDLMRYYKLDPSYVRNALKKANNVDFTDAMYRKYHHFPLPANRVTSSNGVLKQNSEW